MELSMLWWLLASTPIGVGFAGNILPMLPARLDDSNRIGAVSMTVLVWLTPPSQLAGFLAGSLGAKHAGASRQVVWGATLGSVAGMAAKIAIGFTMLGIFLLAYFWN